MEKADLSSAKEMIDEVITSSSSEINKIKEVVGDVKKDRSKKMRIFYIVLAVLILISCLALLKSYVLAAILLGVSVFISVLTFSIISASVSKKFKKDVVNEVVKYTFGKDATYNPIRGYKDEDVVNLKLIRTGNLFQSSDLINGEYKGVKFSCANVLTGQEHYDSSSKTTETDIYFKGVIACYEFNKSLDGIVEIREDEAGFGYSLILSKRNKVEFEDIEFNKQFNVFATDELKAFYIVTPIFIEAFKEIKRRIPGSLIFMVRNDKLFIVINGARNDFEFNIKDAKASEDEVIKSLIKELIPFKWFVDILNLSDKFVSNK